MFVTQENARKKKAFEIPRVVKAVLLALNSTSNIIAEIVSVNPFHGRERERKLWVSELSRQTIQLPSLKMNFRFL